MIPEAFRLNLRLHKAHVSNEKECIDLRDEIIKRDSKINHVVASLGGWWQNGVLSEQSVDEFQKVFVDLVKLHFIVYKTFSKVLIKEPKSTYTFITGALGEGCETMPDTSLLCTAASSIFGLYLAAYSEHLHNPNLKINEVRFGCMISDKSDKEINSDLNDYQVGKDWTAKYVTKVIIDHKSGSHRIYGRKQGDEFYNNF